MIRTPFVMLAAALCVSLTTHSSANAESPQKIMEKLIGRWEIDEAINQGEEIPEKELEGSYAVITKDTIITYDRDKKETYKATYKLNTEAKPMQIDMRSSMGGRKVTALGIISFEWLDLDGEKEFTLAYSLKPGERPKKFESPKDSKIMLMELEQEDDD